MILFWINKTKMEQRHRFRIVFDPRAFSKHAALHIIFEFAPFCIWPMSARAALWAVAQWMGVRNNKNNIIIFRYRLDVFYAMLMH